MKPVHSTLRRLRAAFACAAAAVALCACATPYSSPVRPPLGFIYTNVKSPLTHQFNGNPCGTATKKVSRSNTTYVRDFIITGLGFGWDDVAIAKLAKEGGIKEVSYADYELFNILGIYGKYTINVYGN